MLNTTWSFQLEISRFNGLNFVFDVKRKLDFIIFYHFFPQHVVVLKMKLFLSKKTKNKNFNQNPLERRRDTFEEKKLFFRIQTSLKSLKSYHFNFQLPVGKCNRKTQLNLKDLFLRNFFIISHSHSMPVCCLQNVATLKPTTPPMRWRYRRARDHHQLIVQLLRTKLVDFFLGGGEWGCNSSSKCNWSKNSLMTQSNLLNRDNSKW